jgi:hypothetical protein
MCDKHWSDEQLVARLYGIGPEDSHLELCPSCAKRWEAIRLAYENARPSAIEMSDEYFAAQRRAIRTRLGRKRRTVPRVLVPVLVTLLLAAIVIVYKPSHKPPPTADEISDSQLFEDVFRRVSGTEPSAVVPIRSLFEEQK